MRPRHECPYSEVPIATAYIIAQTHRENRPIAQKSHKKKTAPASTKPTDISPPPDTSRAWRGTKRGGGGTVAAGRRNGARTSTTAPRVASGTQGGKQARRGRAGGTHDEMRARRRTPRPATRRGGERGGTLTAPRQARGVMMGEPGYGQSPRSSTSMTGREARR